MKQEIHHQLMKIKGKMVSDIELIALVTDTSYEVIFYANYNGELIQSNKLVEDEVMSSDFIDGVYENIASIVRRNHRFDPDKMNIIKVSGNKISTEYEQKNCSVYTMKKEWKKGLFAV